MRANLTIVVAIDKQGGIGANNALPWHLPEDLAHFKRVTSGHPIIMGRKTFDSIGRPLPNRHNIVITRDPHWKRDGVTTAASVDEAINLADTDHAFLIGGAQIFMEAMPYVNRLIVTEIDSTFNCDTFFPAIDPKQWKEVSRESHQSDKTGLRYAFVNYDRR